MILIKPNIQHQSNCLYCQNLLKPTNVIWQGMHICVKAQCCDCGAELIEDLKIGHAVTKPYQIDLENGMLSGDKAAEKWLGEPLLESLQKPECKKIRIAKEVFKHCEHVIILNCIDYLYGHCLLKLLNAQRHLEHNSDYGLIVILPKALRWMVPNNVSEIWIVDISLKESRYYYPSLDQFIHQELNRFSRVYISEAYSHPSQFDITRFTGVAKHNFEREEFRITFIWREDRTWCNYSLFRVLEKTGFLELALAIQNRRIQHLFKQIRHKIPSAKFAIAGLGRKTIFPQWIEDMRTEKFDKFTEERLCQVYSESRLVVGVHGSNMLLPSAHAGMTIDLMPSDRWGNFAQDILCQEVDPRLAAFKYRCLPITTSVAELASIASTMILTHQNFNTHMTVDK